MYTASMFATAIRAEAEIEAPIEQVWSVLRDIPNYAAWNPFTPRIDTTLELGTPVMLHVAMKLGRPLLVQKEIMSRYEEGRLMAWGDVMGAAPLLKFERIQELTALSATRTRYFTEDAFSGALVPVVMALYRRHIQRGFSETAAALKAHIEQRERTLR
jgi:hypothetical protein